MKKYGENFDITIDLICDIYNWRNPGEKSEFALLNTFMDSELIVIRWIICLEIPYIVELI